MSFEVALVKPSGDQSGEIQGNYHNLTRERGIYGDIAETRNRSPSLTFRVVIAANLQIQKPATQGDIERR